MEVRANTMGFYKGQRIRPGAVFEMDDKAITKDKDGKIVKPKWVSDAAVPERKASKKGDRGDTKPAAAKAAVTAKTSGAGTDSGDDLA